MALDQVLCHQHRGSTQLAVALTNECAVSVIDFIALVSRREQTGSSVDRAGRGVMLDRPGLSRESRRRDNIDAGYTEQ
jgi:hypothetical protein